MINVAERVINVTSSVLEIDSNQIKPAHAFAADLGARSVQSIELVAMFEEEFEIEMDEDAALAVATVADAIEYITQVCKEQKTSV